MCERRSNLSVIQLLEPRRLFAEVGFQQDTTSNAIVSFEAEAFDNTTAVGNKSWVKVTGSTHSGASAMQGLPNTSVQIDSNIASTSPRLDFRVNFVKTGIHYIWLRGLTQGGDADSIHGGLDGVVQSNSDKIQEFTSSRSWSNRTKDGPVASIHVSSVGQHTFNLWVREDGFIVDKVVLTKSSGYTPSGVGPASSARQLADGETPPKPVSPMLNGLSLINTTNASVIGAFTGGELIYGSQITLRADAGSGVASVKFVLDGTAVQTENSAPYSIAGESNGGSTYNVWTPSIGAHTLVVTPYSQVDAAGIAGTPITVNFTVVDDEEPDPPPPPPPPPTNGITSLTLMNAVNDTAYGPAANYPSISYATLETMGITFKAETVGKIGSIRWGLDGSSYKIEGTAPYSINGDDNTNLRPFDVSKGEHTITATAYSAANATGAALGTITHSFTVVDTPGATNPPPPEPEPGEDGFVSLFNGSDLDGFYTYIEGKGVDNDPEDFFKVTNGMVHVMGLPSTSSTKPFGYLSTEESYSNYHLKFQYKWGTKKFAPRNSSSTPRDSGVLFHVNGTNDVWPSSVEAQIQENDTGDIWLLGPSSSQSASATTTVVSTSAKPVTYKEGGSTATVKDNRIIKSQKKENLTSWNTVEIIADGDTAVVIVNGAVVNRVTNIKKGDGSSLSSGKIAFQAEGAEIYYRDIEIKPLSEYGVGAEPTSDDAVILFDGTSTSNFVQRDDGSSNKWDLSGGTLVVDPDEGDVKSVDKFTDYKLHLEFQVPVTPISLSEQDRGNSGVGLAGSYELQILDSYGRTLADKNDVGSIYGVRDARINAALPAGVWQTYEVTFTAPRYDSEGDKTSSARITVLLNGKLVQDNVEITGATFTFESEQKGPRPIILQDHGNLVKFRNIWVDPS
jgi:hypothetical protein